MNFRLFLPFLIFQLFFFSAFSQKTSAYTNVDAGYKKAVDFYEKGKYSNSQREFQKVISAVKDPNSELKMNAEFYSAMCAFKLFNKDAADLFLAFMEHNAQSPKVKQARYCLGIYSYRYQHWPNTIKWFELVNVHDLSAVELPEYNFKLGYAYLQKGDSAKAQTQFFSVKDEPSEFKVPALFYYSHLEYKNGNYETALKGFEQLKGDRDFGSIVPYYISQIYFLQKKYEELVAYATPLLDSVKPTRALEISRLIGEGHYGLSHYEQALPYLKKYVEESGTNSINDIYQLAFTNYKVRNYQPAILGFQKVVDKETSLGQMALYYIGDSYMQVGNKESARSAFRFASKGDFDPVISENSTFNYAKLSYELSLDPYHEAIYALEDFIKRFPQSERIDDARKYLLEVYLTTKDYKQALGAIEKIQKKGPELQYAYQRIAYFQAIERFNDEKIMMQGEKSKSNFNEAIYYFNRSMTYNIDPKITAECHYWKAEAYYRLDSLNKALTNYSKFLSLPEADHLPEARDVYYNVGYCYFTLAEQQEQSSEGAKRDYLKAADAFRKFISENEGSRNKKLNDAYIKTADCYLITRSYFTAVEFYNKAIALGLVRTDYALFNEAIAYGLLKKPTDKADALATLIYKYPQSIYADDAEFMLGDTYFKENQYAKAIEYFQKAITDHPGNSELVQKSYVKIGLVQRNQGNGNEALENFEKAIKANPSSSEVKNALDLHKATSAEIGNAERHEQFRVSIGVAPLSTYEADSLFFYAAKIFYDKKDCDGAVKNFGNYLEKFPSGFFAVDAHFYKAECQYDKGLFDAALPSYEFVVGKPKGDNTEEALYKAAVIYQKQKNSVEANKHFEALELIAEDPANIYDAQLALMRDYASAENHSKAIEYADKVLKNESSADNIKQEANLVLARNYLSLFDWEKARNYYSAVSGGTENERAVEAKYSLAYILYVQQDYDGSIKDIYAFAKKFSSYKKWVTKGMLLLADNFIAKGDLFQAKSVLTTVIDNYKGEDLKQQAVDKLKSIEKSELPTQSANPEQDIIIDFGGEKAPQSNTENNGK
ncbi:MAG: tetratricopeptide repeat protein [Bacteroidetes bacterium]|nr:tetratricopeptide repeat protein [Bacteroidota bacterium]